MRLQRPGRSDHPNSAFLRGSDAVSMTAPPRPGGDRRARAQHRNETRAGPPEDEPWPPGSLAPSGWRSNTTGQAGVGAGRIDKASALFDTRLL